MEVGSRELAALNENLYSTLKPILRAIGDFTIFLIIFLAHFLSQLFMNF